MIATVVIHDMVYFSPTLFVPCGITTEESLGILWTTGHKKVIMFALRHTTQKLLEKMRE